MTETDARALFTALDGEWMGTNVTWFEPEVVADASPIRARVRALPGEAAASYTYDSSLQGRPFTGAALFAFDSFGGRVDGAWSDSFHMSTNLMVSHGDGNALGFSLLGSYRVPGGGPAWGWRTVFELDGDRLTVTAFNITPAGDEARAVQASYERVR